MFRIATDQWEERAYKVLSNFSFAYPDEIDMHEICWRYGIKIKPLAREFVELHTDYELVQDLKAFSIPKEKGRKGTIFLRENLPYIERKLLLAEEFCHIYAHYLPQLKISSYAICKTENQAKRMSAYLLLPSAFLREVINTAYEQPVVISEIADHFLVPEEFAQYRLKLIFNRRIDAMITFRGKLGSLHRI
ncbi:ImmA/IrrE family metallo-endopeptidase [Bacillus badius]|uniref:ImmA/IrrE family metallo-endopeptidase n=1 Tax=Bacillus badius TaxID=1455 RepID=UPI0005971367|nr:ImmA/IrrE family metallo-endopeptidase [Bacillus badius]MED4718607.1 ImmA/IrrE family metallo-endopeptidase [Bacillus badius]